MADSLSGRMEELVTTSEARSPSGKAKVCKTFIGGSIPPRASNAVVFKAAPNSSYFPQWHTATTYIDATQGPSHCFKTLKGSASPVRRNPRTVLCKVYIGGSILPRASQFTTRIGPPHHPDLIEHRQLLH